MILYINTIGGHDIEVALEDGNRRVAESKIKAPYKQAEKLLVQIDGLLKKNKVKLADISEIKVENKGGTFTSLRIGVALANALSYALNIPVCAADGTKISKKNLNIVRPIYDKEPSITQKARVLK